MAAIWTTTDRDNVKAAIMALATGSRAASITLADKSVTYTNTDMDKLKTLLGMIVADIEANATVGGFTNKIKFVRPV